MKRFFNVVFAVIVLGLAGWGLYSILAEVSYLPGSYRHHRPGGWVYGGEAVRLGIMWIVVSGYMAAEFWLPEGMITRPVRVVMGVLLAAIIALLFILIPATK